MSVEIVYLPTRLLTESQEYHISDLKKAVDILLAEDLEFVLKVEKNLT